tara:strand:- start:1713 stop:2768 length:1056 start_codon:yes stop_codon:yes gene_type:complete
MAYTVIDNPKEYFNTVLYTGNGSTSHAISNVGFSPNWVWVKERGGANSHMLCDTVRSATNVLFSNLTNAEDTGDAGSITAFGSDGFTVGNSGNVNANNDTYVGWNWKAGTSFTNDASATGVGSIDSAGSVSTDAGFSIVSWTGTGSNGTISHRLGSVPKMIIIKDRSNTRNWQVYHVGYGNSGSGQLNLNAAFSGDGMFQSTDPTSTVFSVGTSVNANASGANIIAYCFAEVKGYSKFGSYVGNGSATNGTFVYLGFRPAFVLWKRTQDSGYDWDIYDTARDTHNVAFKELLANGNGAESDGTTLSLDILSNGFKLRTNNNNGNASGKTYIYMAFAENPFVTSTGIPATAR